MGVTPEMAIVGNVLYVRTGGQFTSIKDGEIKEKGSFGVSAIDTRNGKTLWRYKGADKGLTNFVFADANTILIADKDDLMTIDARSGKRVEKFEHDVEKAQFVLINERGQAIVGGRDEIAAFQFQIPDSRFQIKGLRVSTVILLIFISLVVFHPFSAPAPELCRYRVNAPEGKRFISQQEATGLVIFAHLAAIHLMDRAKEYQNSKRKLPGVVARHLTSRSSRPLDSVPLMLVCCGDA